MSELVSLTRDGEIGVITVNNPPVNALGHALRSGLEKAFNEAKQAEADK